MDEHLTLEAAAKVINAKCLLQLHKVERASEQLKNVTLCFITLFHNVMEAWVEEPSFNDSQ
jgi:hypothetical protein